MSRTFHVAVVGATGAVGREMLRILHERRFPVGRARAFASDRSAGKRVFFGPGEIEVEPLGPRSFEGVELALFSAGASVSREHCPRAAQAGAPVVDNSSPWRLDPDRPLVLPEGDPPGPAPRPPGTAA